MKSTRVCSRRNKPLRSRWSDRAERSAESIISSEAFVPLLSGGTFSPAFAFIEAEPPPKPPLAVFPGPSTATLPTAPFGGRFTMLGMIGLLPGTTTACGTALSTALPAQCSELGRGKIPSPSNPVLTFLVDEGTSALPISKLFGWPVGSVVAVGRPTIAIFATSLPWWSDKPFFCSDLESSLISNTFSFITSPIIPSSPLDSAPPSRTFNLEKLDIVTSCGFSLHPSSLCVGGSFSEKEAGGTIDALEKYKFN
mmetsp:Transcript_8639/g.11939  ORF Transcript_8639/g.11939 Transcript_8639/m.11939 type:complete len:253 (-) Transcript_8639:182-940(-)